MSELPTTLRDGRYAVIGVLGEGTQAQTLAAVDKLEGRPVAIKRFVVRGARSWKEVELAEREARVLSGLSHPNLPAYVEHFEENGELYLVMERLEGESLQQIRNRGGRLSRADVVRLLHELGGVLDYLHGSAPPIIHRDIKPGNVIVRPDGRFMLVDFGSVRDRLRPEGGSTVVGTFGYMAPEQFQGRALPQTDVYALGATALSLMTGRAPEELPHQGLRIDVQRAVTAEAELVRLLEQLVEPDPDRRPTRVLPLLGALDAEDGDAARPRAEAGSPFGQGAQTSERSPVAPPRVDYPRGEPLPPLVLLVLLMGLAIARVSVRVAVGVLVPTLLTLLAVLFGGGLRRAARQVRAASRRADQALKRASKKVRRLEFASEVPGSPEGAPRVRVRPYDTPARRVRVVDTTAEELDEDERGRSRRDSRAR